jgi:hypothetical protein
MKTLMILRNGAALLSVGFMVTPNLRVFQSRRRMLFLHSLIPSPLGAVERGDFSRRLFFFANGGASCFNPLTRDIPFSPGISSAARVDRVTLAAFYLRPKLIAKNCGWISNHNVVWGIT